jgi:hypothetical protein
MKNRFEGKHFHRGDELCWELNVWCIAGRNVSLGSVIMWSVCPSFFVIVDVHVEVTNTHVTHLQMVLTEP